MKKKAFALAIALALSGCSAPPLEAFQASLRKLFVSMLESRGQTVLRQALQHYEEGDHSTAEASLRKALELGLEPGERVLAHKTLAFINCATERMQECRLQFQLALRADPKAELDMAEAGHPVWGAVFRSLAR